MAPPTSVSTNILTRILATAAIWSIVVVFSERVPVRMVDGILAVLGAALTVVIWIYPSSKERN
ncbi:MAG TPA: hypothetical protein VMV05_02315 [bacterium]|nr:hypothetical protein [bacterium]